jgi:aerobic-type carbon monoxide dehydrogenase small subunit (CoxS/CutS family)
MPIELIVNGQKRTVETDPDRSLLEVLREDLQLTGTKYGCGEAQCGACSVLLDGKRVFSCQTSLEKAAGKQITTIEGLMTANKLHPVQQAFMDESGYQCGYCTPGMIIAAVALLNEKPKPSDEEIVTGMNRNLCRCCGYGNIVSAVKKAAGIGGAQ